MKIISDIANVKLNCTDGKAIVEIDDVSSDAVVCSQKTQTRLCNLKQKDEFKIGDDVFIVLEQTINETKVIAKDIAYSGMMFGNCSDWKVSPIRDWLNTEYYEKIKKLIGSKPIIPMKRDLTSLDGLDEYEFCRDKITLLSASEYAKYHKIIGLKPTYTDWWWTITSASNPINDCPYSVCAVNCLGVLSWCRCDYHRDVRPFFALAPSTIVQL